MAILSVNFNNLLYLTRSSCEKCNYRPPGRNGTCGPAILLEPSNQQSYRGQLLSSNNRKYCTCIYTVYTVYKVYIHWEKSRFRASHSIEVIGEGLCR
jgi:hypothetical protein